MNKVKWGIIGVGDVTEVKSGPAFNKVANSEIKMVMRRNLEKAKDYALRHSIKSFTNNADEVINNSEINAIYIATPPSSHMEYTVKAAEAKKHVYVEKPMAASYNECKKMIEVCESNGVKLFIAYYRRELDYFKKIKEIIESGVIGEIQYVDIKLLFQPYPRDYDKKNLPWRVQSKIAGAGYFYDLASHQFDYLDFLFGPIKSAKGNKTNQLKLYEAEDIVTASFLFESNIIGSGSWSFIMGNNPKVERTEIIGSKGRILFSFFEPDPIEVYTKDGIKKISIDYPKHVQEALINTVVKDILGVGECVSTGESGARTNWVMDEILS